MVLWRISNYQSLNGEGGRRYSARWHTAGSPIVYLAASPPGALLEILVHLTQDVATLPVTYTLLHIAVPDELTAEPLLVAAGNAWKYDIAYTRSLGDAWLSSGNSALASVPSSILPSTHNYLLNPLHPDAARIAIVQAQGVMIDPRLLRQPGS